MGRKVPKGPRVISGELECPRQLLVLPPIIPGARQMLSPLGRDHGIELKAVGAACSPRSPL